MIHAESWKNLWEIYGRKESLQIFANVHNYFRACIKNNGALHFLFKIILTSLQLLELLIEMNL